MNSDFKEFEYDSPFYIDLRFWDDESEECHVLFTDTLTINSTCNGYQKTNIEENHITIKSLFKDYNGDYKPTEYDFGDSVGKEKIWESDFVSVQQD